MSYALLSGEQVELRAGEQRVVIAEVGAGLRSYTVGDQDVLDGYVSREAARDVYKVVLSGDEIDADGTRRLRASLAAAPRQ